jgi:hypothetical protein
MKFAVVVAGFALLQLVGSQMIAGERDLAQKFIGEWEGPRHIRAYYPDGSLTLDRRLETNHSVHGNSRDASSSRSSPKSRLL